MRWSIEKTRPLAKEKLPSFDGSFWFFRWCPRGDLVAPRAATRLSSLIGNAIQGISRNQFGFKSPQLKNKILTLSDKNLYYLWCPRGDLNPHTFRHTHLKRTCLPFHHLGKFSVVHPVGFEPTTNGFEDRYSSNWAMGAYSRPIQRATRRIIEKTFQKANFF